jgi:hypothetical protein|tara:strand:- start:3160 stop:3354 length:195 start_codon:yes stop_codon:yes gene_type:complete
MARDETRAIRESARGARSTTKRARRRLTRERERERKSFLAQNPGVEMYAYIVYECVEYGRNHSP